MTEGLKVSFCAACRLQRPSIHPTTHFALVWRHCSRRSARRCHRHVARRRRGRRSRRRRWRWDGRRLDARRRLDGCDGGVRWSTVAAEAGSLLVPSAATHIDINIACSTRSRACHGVRSVALARLTAGQSAGLAAYFLQSQQSSPKVPSRQCLLLAKASATAHRAAHRRSRRMPLPAMSPLHSGRRTGCVRQRGSARRQWPGRQSILFSHADRIHEFSSTAIAALPWVCLRQWRLLNFFYQIIWTTKCFFRFSRIPPWINEGASPPAWWCPVDMLYIVSPVSQNRIQIHCSVSFYYGASIQIKPLDLISC